MRRPRRFVSWLRLLRLPNALSTAGDLLAGCALGGAALPGPSVTAAGLAALVFLYTGGMALNDWSDRERDRILHPDRPLPAGEILTWHALGGAAVLLVLGTALVARSLAASSRSLQFGMAAGLLGAIVIYDLVASERAVIGPITMGLCRALSMGLGYLLVSGAVDTSQVGIALIPAYGVLVGCLTGLSQCEERTAAQLSQGRLLPTLAAGMAALYLAPAVALPEHVLLLFPCGLLLALWVLAPLRGERVGLTVKRGVFTLVLFDGLICLGAGRPWLAAACVLLYTAIHGSARLISQRGS